ncbi:hypothetical protein GCM10023074_16490 [Microbispora amethystogenes]|uniref:Uncharacterized protein n=2 Tax=Microbispora amethystogenes TaxID=1427754 RepID=A0ABQ4F753_9ACTN|nr:hypothetical protein Mam01_07920 [Microbispora amethystogenes]
MRKKGFTFRIAKAEAGPSNGGPSDSDVAYRSRYGYDERPWQAQHGSRSASRGKSVVGHSPKYLLALEGPPGSQKRIDGVWGGLSKEAPTKGCLAEADRKLYGDVIEWASLDLTVLNIENLMLNGVPVDSRYVEALRRWRSCMSGRGMRFKNPYEAREKADSKESTRAETLAIATADAICNGEAGLTVTAKTVAAEITSELARKNKHAIARHKALQESALTKIRTGQIPS